MILYDKHLQPDGSCKQLLLKSSRLKDASVLPRVKRELIQRIGVKQLLKGKTMKYTIL
jgi:hypothetical protein